jgi:uncharacterized membrane protein YeaQ/YmgE (transglycosylase-associated protein family)
MNLLVSILVGAIAGWLTDQLFKRFSFSIWMQIGLGILGGFVGGWILGDDLEQLLGMSGIVPRIITSLVGAIVILFIAGLVKGKK